MRDLVEKAAAFLWGQAFSNGLDGRCVYLLAPQVLKRLDDQATDGPRSGHIPGSGSVQTDLLIADDDLARWTVREEDDLHGNLVGESQTVSGVGA